MKMCTGSGTAVPDIADHIALCYLLTDCHGGGTHVCILRIGSIPMVDDNAVAITIVADAVECIYVWCTPDTCAGLTASAICIVIVAAAVDGIDCAAFTGANLGTVYARNIDTIVFRSVVVSAGCDRCAGFYWPEPACFCGLCRYCEQADQQHGKQERGYSFFHCLCLLP